MIRQSKHNRSDSQVSEFQKSMLNKLDSLCSPSPTFDSVDTEVSSLLDSTNKSSNLRRRRLYHSPGTVGVLQSPGADPAAAARAAREAKRTSIGNILAERARLVQKTLTRNALASQQSSTPVRRATSSRLENSDAIHRSKLGSVLGNASAPLLVAREKRITVESEAQSASDNMILGSLSSLETTDARIALREPISQQSFPDPSDRSRLGLSRPDETRDAPDSSTLSISKRRCLTSASVPQEDSLRLTAFSTKRKRYDRNVQWFALVCASIKRLVEYAPLPSEDVSRCTCLQLALVATKPVTTDDTDWLPQFGEHIAQLIQAAGKCPLHKRSVRSSLKDRKLSKRGGQSVLDEENMRKLVSWLQDSRTLLMERLARSIQLLL